MSEDAADPRADDEDLLCSDIETALSDILDELSESDRQILKYYANNWPSKDIADEMNLTAPAVRTRVHRLKKRIWADLARRGIHIRDDRDIKEDHHEDD